MNNRVVKNLSGHSGCIVNLVEENGLIFVSKLSSDMDYNFRLKKQSKKQNNFVSHSNVYTPKIFRQGFNHDGLYYFDMEFIQGKTLAEYTNSITIIEISDFIKCLFRSLYWEEERIDPKTNQIFQNKINSLKKKCSSYQNLDKAFNILENFDWSRVYKSACHGDLTLENILITKDRKLYLIDFLDSFYNSWQIDIAKLLQDVELKWSFRNEEISPNRALRLEVVKEALIEEILKVKNGAEKLDTIYHLLLLNIIRIYPYTKDYATFLYLNNAIKILIGKFIKEEMEVIK